MFIMKKLIKTAAVIFTAVLWGCGTPDSSGTGDDNDAADAGDSDGGIKAGDACDKQMQIEGDFICYCGNWRTVSQAKDLIDRGITCGDAGSDSGSTCGLLKPCPIPGATCEDAAKAKFVCQPCGWLPEGLNCPKDTDAGTDTGSADTGTDTGPADTGCPDAAPVDSGTTDTGTLDSGSPDTGTPDTGVSDTGTAPVEMYWFKVCAAVGDVPSTKDIELFQWGDDTSPASWASCAKSMTSGGLDCHSCYLAVRKGKDPLFNSEIFFTKLVTFAADAGKTMSQDHIYSCYMTAVGGSYLGYGTVEGKKPDGTPCTFTAVPNGVLGCNLRCN